MRLHILDMGQVCAIQGAVFTPGYKQTEWITVPVPAYVIVTADEVYLIDTGMHDRHIVDPDYTWRGHPLNDLIRPVMRPINRLAQQLNKIGLGVQDVTAVISTHFHWDHAGGHRLFPGIPNYVQRVHYEAALDNPLYPPQYWRDPNLTYVLLDGDTELTPGLTTLVTPGHAPGHQSIHLSLPRTGPVILAIDAIPLRANLDLDVWTSQPDPEAARESAQRLTSLSKATDALLIYGHDPYQWGRLRRVYD